MPLSPVFKPLCAGNNRLAAVIKLQNRFAPWFGNSVKRKNLFDPNAGAPSSDKMQILFHENRQEKTSGLLPKAS